MNIFDLIVKDKEVISLNDVYLSATNKRLLDDLLKEYKYSDLLSTYGLNANHKIIMYGASGCGKTMLAKAIAHALGKSILILNLSNIVNARIGETSQNIKHIFEKAIRDKAVLFLDEFDQLGKQRVSDENDVGEMRRLVNSLLQQLDYLPNSVLLIAATNHLGIIDDALVRRFQLRLPFELPSRNELDDYYDDLLNRFPEKWRKVERSYDVSFAEGKDRLLTSLKAQIIHDLEHSEK